MGIRIARATICSTVALKNQITKAAAKALTRLIESQLILAREVFSVAL